MSREIKYRAWDKLNKKMCKVTIIDFSNENINIVRLHCRSNEVIISFEEVDLMECLGVKDKKGKEIWEGDIVKWTYPDIADNYYKDKTKFGSIFGTIYWNNENCSFYIKQINVDSYKFNKDDLIEMDWSLEFYSYDGQEFEWNELEIVGNIYENKEFYERKLEKYKSINKEE